jgi:phosphate transport system substrate-binding protein
LFYIGLIIVVKPLNTKKMKTLAIIFFACVMLNACNQSSKVEYNETATRGNIKVGVDESFRMLIDTEIFTFSALYKYANIKPLYKTEVEVIDDFMKDSVRTIITAKLLTQNQIEYLRSKSIVPKTDTIAIDAVAFIVNKKNPDSLVQINSIRQIFSGFVNEWSQINKKNKAGKIEVVFDNNKSANTRYFIERLNIKEFPKNCYTAQTNDEVINYVEKNKNAIGIISVNWISENTDETSNNFLKRVTVVGLTSELDPEGRMYYRPYPAYIADQSYPFTRKIYMITRETFIGLGSGLKQFVMGEKGQRIVLKAGLVPSTMPIRLVEMKSK